MDIKNIFAVLFHLVGVAHFGYAIYYDVSNVLPEEEVARGYSFGGKFIYISFLNSVRILSRLKEKFAY
jgi:hypothetical protein